MIPSQLLSLAQNGCLALRSGCRRSEPCPFGLDDERQKISFMRGSIFPLILTCRAVLFDMDGTLVDSTCVVERAWSWWAKRHDEDRTKP